MKFEACSRHSDGYLLEVKPAEEYEITVETTSGHDYAPIITGIPLRQEGSAPLEGLGQREDYAPNQAETFQKACIGRHQLSSAQAVSISTAVLVGENENENEYQSPSGY
jgi:hypothetical protein